MAQVILTTENLEKTYGLKPVLKGLSFSLEQGKIMLVVGRNGVGKSTLLKILAGAVHQSKGSVQRYFPRDKLAYMGHKTFLYSRMTAYENLMFWAQLYGIAFTKDVALKTLSRTGLQQVVHERVGHFSRGMAQRMSLARVLLLNPDVLFLDEPGTGLDVQSRQILVETLIAMKEKQKTIVWVTHDFSRDAHLADLCLELKGPGTWEMKSTVDAEEVHA